MRINQVKAHSAVTKAVKNGLLPKLDGEIFCLDCSEPATDYDHRDYLKPLEVDSVCRSCNMRRGAGLNKGKVIGPTLAKSDWHEKTQSLIANTDMSIKEISEATGLQDRWLRLLKADKLRDPGINKCWLVHNYLKRRK